MSTSQKGFSRLQIIAVIVILVVVAVAGWLTYSALKKDKQPVDNTPAPTAPPSPTARTQATKTYTNKDYGFGFKYPTTWSLTENLADLGRGALEGAITITSPYGTVITFAPTPVGTSADCIDPKTRTRTERTCAIVEILTLTQFPSGANRKTYTYEAKITPPTSSVSVEPTYAVGIIDNAYGQPVVGKTLSPAMSDKIPTAHGFVNIDISGPNDSKRASKLFLYSTEAAEAVSVLKTFQYIL